MSIKAPSAVVSRLNLAVLMSYFMLALILLWREIYGSDLKISVAVLRQDAYRLCDLAFSPPSASPSIKSF